MKRPTGIAILLLVLIVSTGLTLGLTYAPCYASLCSEEFFPFETRVHIAVFYALLAITGCFLFLRAWSPWWHAVSTTYVTRKELPVLQKRISVGGLALSVWLLGITLATTPFWLTAEYNFWTLRADGLAWPDAKIRLTVTGIIGHHTDYLLGLVLIPVSRNSVLGRVFELHQSTLLYAHKLIAYTLLAAVVAHGAVYYTFVGTYAAAKDDSPKKSAFHIDNPTLNETEMERRGYWYATTLPSGMLAFLLMALITITALPVVRRKSYNTFYYVHVISSSLIFILTSIHASTDFYFLVPGLLLWILDLGWRASRGGAGGSRNKVIGTLESAEGGWYRITLPAGRYATSPSTAENDVVEKQEYLNHPLQTYYLNIPSISKVQNHAFTAAEVGSAASGPVFLFQKAQPSSVKKKQKKQDNEWTWKVGAAASGLTADETTVDSASTTPMKVEVRVEGPYIPIEASGFQTADRVLCIVGGTGLTGAYSMALWWLENRTRDARANFTLIWTVRHRGTAELSEWRELEKRVSGVENIQLRLHVSSESGRMDANRTLREECSSSETSREAVLTGRKGWVYVSGPAGLLNMTESACVDLEYELRRARRATDQSQGTFAIEKLEHYVAKWEV
ncbi:hypothetical protein LTR37_008518 [Vermiconidia calcicola]|uniref:Uncharacterized protein n=1 Tax=Vermiconidia calcicola TaxID=1690605 RepID=A0ACC3NA66_9PEZI|nr:hypothetical protein LTR37_008518 [Vermiconidia calcicola]